MKLTTDLALNQSFSMTTDVMFAIDILAMSSLEIDQLLSQEFEQNPCLEESEEEVVLDYVPLHRDKLGAFDIALKKNQLVVDFRDHLIAQIGEGKFNRVEVEIAEMLVKNLDDDGFLKESEDVFVCIKNELFVFDEWIESVRLRILDLDPLGCGARDVFEALSHQAKHLCSFPHEEFIALINLVKSQPKKKLTQLMLTPMKSDKNLHDLKKLNPRPASGFTSANPGQQSIVPDILVTVFSNAICVSLAKTSSRRLVFKRTKHLKKDQRAFLRAHKKRASVMLRAIRFREKSLLTVARAIVLYQEDWFLSNKPLKPLNLRTIAGMVGLHESSISRLTKEKYLLCDHGTFELKHFFSAAVGEELGHIKHSALFIKEQICLIISRENKSCPLSDQKIVTELQARGIIISRRTVNKYREALKIRSMIERRVLIA